jgi:folate-binding protein YgfZ
MLSNEPLLNFKPSGMVTPDHLGVILAEGADAAGFLQGQLTHDVLLLPTGQARLAGYCSAKGRLLGTFLVLKRSPESFLLVSHQDLVASLVKRLSMFVMRAKVKISEATSNFQIRGIIGQVLNEQLPSLLSLESWGVLPHQMDDLTGHFVKLYPAVTSSESLPRALWIGPTGLVLPSPLENSPALSHEDWDLAEVLSGICMVQTATVEAFVPQMINYESVDGVSFKKGCYPGQEVVARSQFRGTLKRRAYVVSSATALQVGLEVFSSADTEQACGMVASAAVYQQADVSQPASYWGIVSMQTAAAEQTLHLGSAEGPGLEIHTLPYPLLEDI